MPTNEIEFPVPGTFRHGDSACEGDTFLCSSDGVYFCVLQCIVGRASPVLQQHLRKAIDTLHGFPLVKMRQDAETVCYLLQALYPGPVLPITDIPLAYKCEAAAFSYGVSPTVFTYDRNLFSEANKEDDPIGLCALAWNAGEWTLLEEASRWVHRLDLVKSLTVFQEVVGGPEVISALIATQMEREDCIRRVVERLPKGIICHFCRSTGRDATAALIDAVSALFKHPFPETAALLNGASVLATPQLLRACRSKGCRTSMRKYKYSTHQADAVNEAIKCVPQSILPRLVDLRRANQRGHLQATWEAEW